jgi:4-hydroxymandelate oxidase
MSTPPLTLADQAAQAERLLEPAVWAYLCGGAADELTLRANLSAWRRLQAVATRAAAAGGRPHPQHAAGPPLAHPILLAPVAYQRWPTPTASWPAPWPRRCRARAGAQHPGQHPAGGRGQAGARRPGRGPLWFQLYLQPTAASPRAGAARRSRRLRGPGAHRRRPVPTACATANGAPASACRPACRPSTCTAHRPRHRGRAAARQRAVRRPAAPRPHLGRRGLAAGPHPAAGAAQGRAAPGRRAPGRWRWAWPASIVSNHGGRTLDTAPATANALPASPCAGGAWARACPAGRRRHPARHRRVQGDGPGCPRGAGGPADGDGAGRRRRAGRGPMLRLLRDELEMAMALTGCATLADIGPALLDPGAAAPIA